eukprot:TRINITY_DN12510_c0_g1_i8.p4 TRINITY_DN12510_c0_g1~~TRINITY_DN12510_c0_g1_i8.p4  ORF type:complete len:103 (+),score=18.33 TRINITY_DN12510_c0_g1_i8:101-409(+)
MLSAFMRSFPGERSVGWTLMEALQYYGKEFDARCFAVCGGRRIAFKTVPSPELTISDVFLPEVNAAANVTLFEKIKEVFARACDRLYSQEPTFPLLDRILTT